MDFAGSIVVHAVGGSVALAILCIVGSRTGRFPKGKHPQKINPSNLPLAVGGLLHLINDHSSAAANFCLDAIDKIQKIHFGKDGKERIQMRIGLNTGKVVAGVIGLKNFVYDIWGDAVNVASRMESYALPNTIHLTEKTAESLKDNFILEKRDYMEIKGKGKLLTYFLKGRRDL